VRVGLARPAAALALLAMGLPAPAVARPALDSVLCGDVVDDVVQTTDVSTPLGLLRIKEAQALAKGGAGVNVAVLDSGVSRQGGLIPVVGGTSITGRTEIDDPHGTAVASLIAGASRPGGKLLGVAPAAGIVDVRVYDTAGEEDDERQPLTPGSLAAGLTWVAEHARELHIKVANVSLAVDDDDALEAAVEAARAAGVIVVAETGSRTGVGPMAAYPEPVPGEDAAKAVFPAGYIRDVIGVNATAGGSEGNDASLSVAASSATDVAAPTYGAVVVAVNGSTCTLQDINTSWAAAEVSGVLALLWARFPDENPNQITARLLATASGTMDNPTRVTGVGVVQPVEALTRQLRPGRDGQVSDTRSARDENPRARAPEPEVDNLAPLRQTAKWAALVGGAALLLALLLRPVLARRRDG
jgi:membrane-anchored mycosin MYCP